MALLAESLVDEWLNRQRFFTVRGIKHGVEEIDLLGVRPSAAGHDAWHVEVQASFRPIGYISPIPAELSAEFGAKGTSAKKRPPDIVQRCAEAWVESKFTSPKKFSARESTWQGLKWEYVFVHAMVRDEQELEAIKQCGIRVVPLHTVLSELKHELSQGVRGGAGTDLAEVIEYFHRHGHREN